MTHYRYLLRPKNFRHITERSFNYNYFQKGLKNYSATVFLKASHWSKPSPPETNQYLPFLRFMPMIDVARIASDLDSIEKYTLNEYSAYDRRDIGNSLIMPLKGRRQ